MNEEHFIRDEHHKDWSHTLQESSGNLDDVQSTEYSKADGSVTADEMVDVHSNRTEIQVDGNQIN